MPLFDEELLNNLRKPGNLPSLNSYASSPYSGNYEYSFTPPSVPSMFGGYADRSQKEGGITLEEMKKATPTFNFGFGAAPRFVSQQELNDAANRYGFFKRGVDLEDIAAQRQSPLSRFANGIIKGLGTAGGTFISGFGTIPHAIDAFRKGSNFMDEISSQYDWQKDISENIKQFEDLLPNYVDKWEREHPFGGVIPFTRGSANFWGDGVFKNLGYGVGAITNALVTDAALVATGQGLAAAPLIGTQLTKLGAGVTSMLGRASVHLGKLAAGTTKMDEALAVARQAGGTAEQLATVRGLAYAAAGTKITSGSRWMLGVFNSAQSEATMEAADGELTITNHLIDQYKRQHNGDAPVGADLEEIKRIAGDARNVRYGINMALLVPSNAFQFGSLLKGFFAPAATRALAKGVATDVGKVKLAQGSLDVFEKQVVTGLAPKAWNYVKPTLKNMFAEGVYEEGGQFAAEKGTFDYYTRKYKNLKENGNLENWRTVNEIMTSGIEGIAEQFTSTEGLKSMLIGSISAVIQGGVANKIQTKMGAPTEDQRLQSAINILNRYGLTGMLQNQYSDTLNAAGIAKEMDEAVASGNVFKYKNLKNDMFFNLVNSRAINGLHDVTVEQLKMLKDLDETEFQKTFGMDLNETNQKTVAGYVDALIDKANQMNKSITAINDTFKNPYTRYDDPQTQEEVLQTFRHDTVNEWKTNLAYYSTTIDDVNGRLNNIATSVSEISPLVDTSVLSTLTNPEKVNELAETYEEQAIQLKKTINEFTSPEDRKRINNQVKALRTAAEKIKMAAANKDMTLDTFGKLLNFELSGRENLDAAIVPTDKRFDLYKYGFDINALEARRQQGLESFDKLASEEGFNKFFEQAEEIRDEEYDSTEEEEKAEESEVTAPEVKAAEFKNKAGETELPEADREYSIAQLNKAKVEKIADDRYQVTSPTGELSFYETKAEADAAADVMNEELEGLEKIKVLGINEDGTIKVEDATGNIQNIDPRLMTGYERIETASEKIEKNKEQIEKEQAATELNSGNVASVPAEEGAVISEGKLKDYRQLFTSGITESEDYNDPTQSAPHVKRSREFLNNAKNFKNRNKLAAILVTPNQEVTLGLSGLMELSYGTNDKSGATDVENGFVAQVFVEQDGGKLYFVDKDGKRVGEVGKPVDIQQVVFQTMPTTDLFYRTKDKNEKPKPRYRENQKAEAEAASKAWGMKRAELFAAPAFPVKAYQFTISRGVRRENKVDGKYERNPVGGILIPEDRIAITQGLLKISEGTISHNGVAITIPKGLTVLQYGDTLDIVNNNKFGRKKAKAIYEVLKAFAEDIRKQSEAGKSIKFNRNYTTFLENVLYWRKTSDTKGNQIYVDASNVFLGGFRFPIADIATLESEIVDQLSETYHNINGKTLKDKFTEPFYEYTVDENGKLVEKEWRNYQSYLLSSEGRSAQETPLVTNAAKPTAELPYSFKQKYATLNDFELPVVQAPKVEAKPGVPMIGEFAMDGTTVHTFNGFTSGPVEFTGTVDAEGNINVNIQVNKTITDVAANEKIVNGPIIEGLKAVNQFDAAAENEQLVVTYVGLKLIGELNKLKEAQQQEAPSTAAVLQPDTSTVAQAQGTARTEPVVTAVSELPLKREDLPEYQSMARTDATQKLADFAAMIYGVPKIDIKTYGDFSKWFQGLGDAGYEVSLKLNGPRLAYDILLKEYNERAAVKETKPTEPTSISLDLDRGIGEALVREMLAGKPITDFTPAEQGFINRVPIERKEEIRQEQLDQLNQLEQEKERKLDEILTWRAQVKKKEEWETAYDKQLVEDPLGWLEVYVNADKKALEIYKKQIEEAKADPNKNFGGLKGEKYIKYATEEIKKIEEQQPRDQVKISKVRAILDEYNANLAKIGAKPTGGTYNPNDTGAPADEYQRVAETEAGEERLTDAEIALFKAWAKENVPGIPFEILDNLVNTYDNQKAWGVFEDGVAKFYRGALKGTPYHEIFEGIWKGFLTPEQRQGILDEFRAKSGKFKDRASGKMLFYEEATDQQAKERIADDFAAFRTGKIAAKSLGQKILEFFKQIIEFFKSFVRKSSMKDQLFKAIDSGKFKEAKLPADIKSSRPEYQRIAGLSETQVFDFVQDMTARAANYIFGGNKESLYELRDVTGKEVFDKIKEAYASPQERKYQQLGEERFNQLVKRTKQSLRTLGINFNEEDRIDINDENTSKTDYAPEPFSVDWKKSSPFAIKFVLATLPKTKPTNQQNSTSLSLPERVLSMASGVKGYMLVNFNRAFATVLGKVSNTSSTEKAAEKMANLAKLDADYVRFFQRVGGDLNTGTFNFSNFKDADWRLFVNFMQTFTRQKPDALIQYIKGNEVYTAPANQYTAAGQVERQWLENMKVVSTNADAAIRYNRPNKTYEANPAAFPEKTPKLPEEMVKFLGNIGIIFPLEAYVTLKSDKQDDFAKAVSSIYTYLQKARNISEVTADKLGIGGPLKTLTNLYVNATNPNQDSTYFGVEGQRIQSVTDDNAASLFENEFNEAGSLDQLRQSRPELNDVFSKNSVILKKDGRFYNADGELIRNIKVSYIQGTKLRDSNKGVATSKLTIGKRLTQEINQNINGNYYILVPGDGSTEWMMNLGNHVSFADVEGGRAWNKIYTIFKGYLKDEVALALDADNRKQIKNIGNKAKELRFFKEILSEKNLKEINQLIVTGATESKISEYIDNNISDINAAVKEFIENTAKETRANLESSNQVAMVKEDQFTYAELDSTFATSEGIRKFRMSNDDVNNLVTFLNANYIINNIEFHKVLFGDPYQFAIKNGKLDETKRIKSFLSPRRRTIDSPEFNTFLNDEYNKSGDVQLLPTDLGYHENKSYTKTATLSDIEFGTSLYPKVNEADAASWVIDNTYREVKLKNGQWSKEAENWHQWQMAYMRRAMAKKGAWSYEGREALQKADNELLSKPEPTFVTEVLKPIVSGVKNNENKIDIVLDKFSQMPLYYKSIEGTNLEKLYIKMMEEKVGYVVMQSGRKAGATALNKFYNEDGSFNENPFEGTIDVAWKSYGIQVENSFENPKEQTRGSQLTKLFSLDFFDNGKASNEAKAEFNKNKEILKQMHENGYNQILKKLGIEDLGYAFNVVDKVAIQETLEYELLRRELNENAIDTIQLDENGEFIIPFEASPAYQQIKNILYSIVNKQLTSPKMNGGPKVQVPVTGWEKGNRDPKGASPALKFYTKEDPYMEVYLPHWFRNKFNKNKFPTDESILNYLNKTDEGKKILTGIGFRIPTQSMSSVEVFRVKGFLPQSMGDTIVVPSEVTAKAGSDFDIDKMNTYLRSVYVDKSGDVRLVKYRGSEEATREFYAGVFDEVLAGKKVKKDDLFEALQIRKYGLDDSKGLVDRYGNLLDTLLSEVENESELEAKLEEELLKLGDTNLQAALKDRFVDEMYKRSLENEYYDSLERMITLPENFDRLVSPVDDAGLAKAAAELDTLRNEDESQIKNRLLNRSYMTNLRHAFVTAKKWVGIAAVNITGQSLTQKTQVYIDPSRFELVNAIDKKWLGDGSIALPHNTITVDGKTYVSISGKMTADNKSFISDRLSGYATAFVDVAKDPYIMKIIKSDLVTSTFMFLERIGVGKNTVLFMNQPIITEYLKYLDAKDAKFLFSTDDVAAVLNKFPATRDSVKEAKIDVAKLKDNIKDYSEGKLGNERNAEQQKILMEFLKYAKMADYSFKLTQATNYDTTKFKNSDSFYKKTSRTAMARETNIFSSVDKVLENSFIGDQADLLNRSMVGMGAILKLEQDDYRYIINQVLAPYSEQQYMSADDFDRVANKLKASFLDFIIQTKTGLNSEIRELAVDLRTSVARQLAEAQKKFPNVKILNDLTVSTSDKLEGGAKTVTLKANPKDAFDENTYIEMMRELRDNPETRDLYYDIVSLSILQGSYQSAVSIKNIIPVEDYAAAISETINTLSNSPELEIFSKEAWFQKNNWKDDAVVPPVTPKFFLASESPIDVIEVGDDLVDVYQYYSELFPSIEPLKIQSTDRRVLLLSEKFNAKHVGYDVVKVPRVITMKGGEMVDIVTGRNITPAERVRRIASGESGLNDVFGYQKVRYGNGEPVVTEKGQHVYKLTNLYGDGSLVSEYYTDARPSVVDNGTVKISDNISNDTLIEYFAPRIEERIVSSAPEVASTTKISTPSGKLKLRDGKEYNISDINAELLESIGYKPKEIGKLLKSIC